MLWLWQPLTSRPSCLWVLRLDGTQLEPSRVWVYVVNLDLRTSPEVGANRVGWTY
ncbi:hypothetical protein CPB84DRAFT_1783291 [Gymnopilus junonius]|uniref:Uncharacterized protein n=1 Tax=Gymnopilus junonius TaxID=109634 RepID=A0A9P5NI02_GYMJU|nr:hypothetical protein CPB84DRAFT_1783291 [Gymnopilus junonius]